MSADLSPGVASARTRGGLWLSLLALLSVASLAFAVLEFLDWHHEHDDVQARGAVKAAATQAIPAFTDFDYHNLQGNIKRTRQVLTTCFGDKYAATLERAIPQAQQAQAVVSDVVRDVGVLDLEGDLAHVQVFFDQKAKFGDGRPPKLTPYRVVLDMKKVKGSWKVNYLDLDDAATASKRPC